MLEPEQIRLDELKAVIDIIKDMPPGKRVSILSGVLAVQLLLDVKHDFDARDFEGAFDALSRRVQEVRSSLLERYGSKETEPATPRPGAPTPPPPPPSSVTPSVPAPPPLMADDEFNIRG